MKSKVQGDGLLAWNDCSDHSPTNARHARLYDPQHTRATLLLLADVPAKVVGERFGHSSITLTLDSNSHVLPTMQRKSAELMGQILGRKGGTAENGGTGLDWQVGLWLEV